MIIEDNLLDMEDYDLLESTIDNPFFPWFYQTVQTWDDGPFFCHVLYHADEPRSEFYKPVQNIFKKYINWSSMYRLNVNLCPKIGSTSNFHTDTNGKENEEVMTTAIYYLNTNNGYTEFEDGTKVDSVRNRLVVFPTNTTHRAAGQTDTSKRIVINFNYIEG